MEATRDFLGGVAAGCAFLVVELLGRVVAGVPTLAELAQDRLVLALPGPVFALLLDRLLYLGKPLLFAGLLLAQLGLAGVGGILVARWRRPALLAAALWLLAGLALAPLHGSVWAGQPAVALVALVACAAYGFALPFFARRAPRSEAAPAAYSAERRRLLGGAALLVASLVLARRAIGDLPLPPGRSAAGTSPASGSPQQPVLPAGAALPVPGLPPPVTPADQFYVVSKNLADPEIAASSWRLAVTGLVERPLELRYDDLLRRPAVTVTRTLECISNEIGGDLISNGTWTGLRLADLLGEAGVQPGAAVVHFTCADDYTENLPLDLALDPNTLLVYQLDGQPLAPKHGFPLRVLTTGRYGMKNPKWLTEIQVAPSAPPGFWEQQGWTDQAVVQTMARIDTPAAGSRVGVGDVQVAGIAFAGDRGIQRVELSTDGGATWSLAELLPSLGPNTWTFWRFLWRAPQPGSYTLVARATDGAGQAQPDRETDTFPDGATGYHRVRVQVSA